MLMSPLETLGVTLITDVSDDGTGHYAVAPGGRAGLVILRGGAEAGVAGTVSQVSAARSRSATMLAMPGARLPLASCSIMRSTCSA